MKTALSSKQITAMNALIRYATVKEAAEASGTPIRTLERWLTQPEFLDALHKIQNDCFTDTARAIINAMQEAHEAIRDVLRHPTQQGANLKLKAASEILEQGSKFHKMLNQDVRLKNLEAKAGLDDPTRIERVNAIFCKRIVDSNQRLAEKTMIPPLSQIQIELFERFLQDSEGDIEILTPEERIRFDKAYSDRLKLDRFNKKYTEVLKEKMEPKMEAYLREEAEKKKLKKEKKPDSASESVEEAAQALEEKLEEYVDDDNHEEYDEPRQSMLTDEEIMKWDPENFDTIKRIMAENERQRRLEQAGENDQQV